MRRQRTLRSCALAFALQRTRRSAGALGARTLGGGALAAGSGFAGAGTLARRGLLGAGRLLARHLDAGTPRLGKADGDGLLRRTRAMLAFAHMLDFLMDVFAGL